MEATYDLKTRPERVVLVGIINQDQTEEMAGEYLEELAFLTETAGGEPKAVFTQKLD
ncbi:MAG: GTPase HflX, partial [Bacteroidota bacterium]